jgi:hypothetical protein
VVNAFRHGMDSTQLHQATSNPNIQRVLQKQASLSKRLSNTGSQFIDQSGAAATSAGGVAAAAAALNTNTRIKIAESSFSHTETAV